MAKRDRLQDERAQYVPATLKVIVRKRAKYACRPCQGEVVVAPAPPGDRQTARPGLLAAVTLLSTATACR
ncbi:MAG: hypothetical protein IPK07_14290 [Deltaproteobacteria bacterium]|nr:hypothetical protein [Deltaproteobacteria bacterium]